MSILISSPSLGSTPVRSSLSPTVSVSLSVSPCLPVSASSLSHSLFQSFISNHLHLETLGNWQSECQQNDREHDGREGFQINERWQSRDHPQGGQGQTLSVLESCEGHTEFDVATLVDVGIELLSPLFEHP